MTLLYIPKIRRDFKVRVGELPAGLASRQNTFGESDRMYSWPESGENGMAADMDGIRMSTEQQQKKHLATPFFVTYFGQG